MQKIESDEMTNMLCNKDIPSKLISYYDTIEKSWLRLQQSTPLWQARTWYIRTTSKTNGKRSEIRTTNDSLFIEHSFGNQENTHTTDAYVIISPDRRDNLMAKLWAILIWPFFLLYLFGENLDSLSKLFTRFNINSYIAIWFIMVVAWYIWYIINNKINMQRAITLENRAFEQEFDVDSNDPIIARQICNPVMITDIASRLKNNHLSKYVSIYFDLSTNRIIYKFDFLKHEIWEIHEEYVKECINMTATIIQKIDLLKYINLVYAGTSLSHKTENTQSATPIQTW